MAIAATEVIKVVQSRQAMRLDGQLLPNGRMFGQVQVTGDATAGDIVVTFELALQASQSYWHSIEEAQVQVNDASTRSTRYATGGDSAEPRFAATPNSWNEEVPGQAVGVTTPGGIALSICRFRRNTIGHSNASFVSGDSQIASIIYGPARDALRQVVLRIGNSNALIYIFRVWGYIWSAELVAQGFFPVRPE